jgi:hypothetical protein
MELHGRRGIKQHKNDILRYEHNITLLEREMTQLQTYLLPSTNCPVSKDVGKLPEHFSAVRF